MGNISNLTRLLTSIDHWRRLLLRSSLFGAVFVSLFSAPFGGAAADTRSYVFSWFYMATYSQDGDCPDGLNDSIEQHFRKVLAQLGKSQPEIEALVKAIPGSMYVTLGDRGRIDGKPVSPYLYPTSVPDPQIKTLKGKVGYGFDLDGKDGLDDVQTGRVSERAAGVPHCRTQRGVIAADRAAAVLMSYLCGDP